tara:strand:+ start:226 stop:549 length:324 start_codon:yes stop_codon:yes gene_type:complete
MLSIVLLLVLLACIIGILASGWPKDSPDDTFEALYRVTPVVGRERELALEALEVVSSVEEAWRIIWNINEEVEDLPEEVRFHLECNPHVSYADVYSYDERWERGDFD